MSCSWSGWTVKGWLLKGKQLKEYITTEAQRVWIILAANNAKNAIVVSIFKTFCVPGVICG